MCLTTKLAFRVMRPYRLVLKHYIQPLVYGKARLNFLKEWAHRLEYRQEGTQSNWVKDEFELQRL